MEKSNRPGLQIGRMAAPVAAVSILVMLSACSSMPGRGNSDSVITGSVGTLSINDTVRARKAWQSDPKNLRKAMAYSRQLQALGQTKEQLSLLEQMIKYYPTNASLLAFYGRRLAQIGQTQTAIKTLGRAEALGAKDWRTYSAHGSALDQTGRHSEARRYYQMALKANPKEVKIKNNIALSYTLEGQLDRAEQILRKLITTPAGRAEPRIRQNLALVVGLRGNFKEAREIASRDLPADQVEANMAYLRKMLSRGNTWDKLKKS